MQSLIILASILGFGNVPLPISVPNITLDVVHPGLRCTRHFENLGNKITPGLPIVEAKCASESNHFNAKVGVLSEQPEGLLVVLLANYKKNSPREHSWSCFKHGHDFSLRWLNFGEPRQLEIEEYHVLVNAQR